MSRVYPPSVVAGWLHARPTESWTAEFLAQEVGMSRSVFAERFSTVVGHPPMQYLALWRMHMAAQHLRDGRRSVAQVGASIGYESEAAFSRASSDSSVSRLAAGESYRVEAGRAASALLFRPSL
jgi:AraC-like DNA-binding protein